MKRPERPERTVEIRRQEGGRVDLVLKRSHRANALDSATARAAYDAVLELRDSIERHETRVLVVRGEGRNLCAGADLTEMATLDPAAAEQFIRGLHDFFHALRTLPIPVVVRATGAVLGAGLEMAVSCDLVVAQDDAIFGMPEPHVGLPSVIEAALLPSIVGLGRAREMLLIGDSFDAARALELGLVHRVVSSDELDDAVDEVVAKLARHDARALALQKSLLHRWSNQPLDEAVESGVHAFAMAMATDAPRRAMQRRLRTDAPKRKP